jgi:hypothetical protein
MRITPYLEQLVHEGKAVYKTISMGACQEMVIPVPSDTYIVITGYEYLPIAPLVGEIGEFSNIFANIDNIRDFVQYVNFVNDSNFYAYQHFLNYESYLINEGASSFTAVSRKNNYQSRDIYIISKKNIAVYFTRMTQSNLTLTQNVLVQNAPIFDILGYVGVNAVTTIQEYNDVGAGRSNPLTDPYTVPQYTPNPSRYNQLYTVPQAGGDLDMSSLAGILGKYRANHIVVHYFEINEQPPTNLI